MPLRETLTDHRLKALKPAKSSEKGWNRYIVWDQIKPHLGVRVTEKGVKTFVVVKRRPGAKHPDAHVLGAYPGVTLKAARDAVPGILETLSKGQSPKEVAKEVAREAARRRADTFALAIEQFIEWEAGRELRSAHETAIVLRREFLGLEAKRTKVESKGRATEWVTEWTKGKKPIWRDRPVSEITRRDVIERLEQIKSRGGKHAARHALSSIRKFFNWAVEGERFGIEESPARDVRDKTLGITGKDLTRKRVLTDVELRDVWRAAEELTAQSRLKLRGAKPDADVSRVVDLAEPLVKLLLLTGQRRDDIAEASWREIDLKSKLHTIPPERFKTDTAQLVPLTDMAADVLAALPRFGNGYIFTTTAGVRPIGSISKLKERLDRAIAARRKAERREPMPPWVFHDLRRTVRTRLVSSLGVEAYVAERVIGHALPGLHRVYDQGTHADAKRAALEKWEALLLSIVEPPLEPGGKVVPIRRAKR